MADAKEPNEKDFLGWLTGNPEGKTGIVVAILYIFLVFAKNFHDASLVPETLKPYKQFLNSLPSLLQCVALLPPLFWTLQLTPPEWIKDEIAKKACAQFARCLAALIGAWIVFYFLNFIALVNAAEKPLADSTQKLHLGLIPWIDFWNNLQAVFLFGCYWVLTAITVSQSGRHKKLRSIGLPSVFSYSLWAVFVFQLLDVSISDPQDRFWFQLFSGLAVGICMALTVGCLESEYLNSPRIFTALLYSYAALQLAYVDFNQTPTPGTSTPYQTIQLSATLASLPLKLLFFGICYWHLQTGRLAFYMEKSRWLIGNAEDEWADFSKSENRIPASPPAVTSPIAE